MKNLLYLSFALCFLGCAGERTRQNQNDMLLFLKAGNYKFYETKIAIPSLVIDSISNINKEKYKIGDSSDAGKISLSDATLGDYEYNRKLNFVLLSDSVCLLSYTEGGIGSHDVIDFFSYKGAFKHKRFLTTKSLNDTIKLRAYLENSPNP